MKKIALIFAVVLGSSIWFAADPPLNYFEDDNLCPCHHDPTKLCPCSSTNGFNG
ncbi:MAG: hypothetical protein P1U56_17220 [Saprospiraceae bacterium]|nr:hypothetical protein [Saprospiraceae bacterium]